MWMKNEDENKEDEKDKYEIDLWNGITYFLNNPPFLTRKAPILWRRSETPFSGELRKLNPLMQAQP